MNRIFANQADAELNKFNNSATNKADHKKPSFKTQMDTIKTNFKNCTRVFSRSLKELLLLQKRLKNSVERVYNFIIGRNQKERPNRSYIRKSMKPESKWRAAKKTKKKMQIVAT